jgi:hypothetical protein
VFSYLNIAEFDLHGALDPYVATRNVYAPGLPLILEETATQAGGGCANLSNRYISGFYFLHAIATTGEVGFMRYHRQDVVGWSFTNRPSQYALLGQPGWVSGPLTPNPDYFLALVWKQVYVAMLKLAAMHSTALYRALRRC